MNIEDKVKEKLKELARNKEKEKVEWYVPSKYDGITGACDYVVINPKNSSTTYTFYTFSYPDGSTYIIPGSKKTKLKEWLKKHPNESSEVVETEDEPEETGECNGPETGECNEPE